MGTTSRFTQRWFACSVGVAIAILNCFYSSAVQAAAYGVDFETDAFGNSIKVGDGNVDHGSGERIDDEWADWGLNISGWNNRTNSAAELLLYNTQRRGADNDLKTGSNKGTTPQGNVLIIQERSNDHKNDTGADQGYNFHNPDDEAQGGYINFDFDKAVNFQKFSLLDIDDNGGGIWVDGFDAAGNKVLHISVDDLIAQHKQENGSNGAAEAQGKSVVKESFDFEGLTYNNSVKMTQDGSRWGNNSLFSFEVDAPLLSQVRVNYPGSGAVSGLEWTNAESRPVPEPSAAAGGILLLATVGVRRWRQSQADNQSAEV